MVPTHGNEPGNFRPATSRGVHLELCSDMGTDSFTNVFKNFINHKAIPLRVAMDNFRTFKFSEVEQYFESYALNH